MQRVWVATATLLSVTAYTLAISPPSRAATKDVQLVSGDEVLPGHDLVRVRYTNSPGRIVASAWLAKLHPGDQVGVRVATNSSDSDSYYISVRLVKGIPTARVRAIDSVYHTPTGPSTCVPRVTWSDQKSRITVRAKDACFPRTDLSYVLISTDLGVRGKNYLSDFTHSYKVSRS